MQVNVFFSLVGCAFKTINHLWVLLPEELELPAAFCYPSMLGLWCKWVIPADGLLAALLLLLLIWLRIVGKSCTLFQMLPIFGLIAESTFRPSGMFKWFFIRTAWTAVGKFFTSSLTILDISDSKLICSNFDWSYWSNFSSFTLGLFVLAFSSLIFIRQYSLWTFTYSWTVTLRKLVSMVLHSAVSFSLKLGYSSARSM